MTTCRPAIYKVTTKQIASGKIFEKYSYIFTRLDISFHLNNYSNNRYFFFKWLALSIKKTYYNSADEQNYFKLKCRGLEALLLQYAGASLDPSTAVPIIFACGVRYEYI